MRFGILAPMPSELRPVVKAFGLTTGCSGELEGHVGTLGGADVVATTTGIGIDRATRAVNRMLEQGEVDHVVVVDGSPKVGAALRYVLRHPGKVPGLARLARDAAHP